MIMKLAAAVLASFGFITTAAIAQNEVTLCRTDTEVGQGRNLQQAIAIGGYITFRCPGLPVSIRMTVDHTVPPGVTIDGRGQITLDAQGAFLHMFLVPQGAFFVRDIIFRNARRRPTRPAEPGARPLVDTRSTVINADGFLSLDGVTVEASQGPIRVGGDAYIVRSRLQNNSGTALSVAGNAWIEQSVFVGNGTGLSARRGRVRSAEFRRNTNGGLVVLWPAGELKVSSSRFIGNEGQGAIRLSQRSGREGNGSVVVRDSVFDNNASAQGGGAITIYDATASAPNEQVRNILRRFPPARFELMYNDFTRNRGLSGGAIHADLTNSDGLRIVGSTFTDNIAAADGGAIWWDGGPILVLHSLLKHNRAVGSGGALLAVADATTPLQQVANTLIVENEAPATGAAVDIGAAALINVTLARNWGIGVVAHGDRRPLIANTILSDNKEGNCRGLSVGDFRGGNLQSGHGDCPGVPIGDPLLDPLYIPDLGSPVLRLGDLSICVTEPVQRRDIIFQGRGYDGTCAAGAFEYFPMRRLEALERSTDQREQENKLQPSTEDPSETEP